MTDIFAGLNKDILTSEPFNPLLFKMFFWVGLVEEVGVWNKQDNKLVQRMGTARSRDWDKRNKYIREIQKRHFY